MSLLKAILSPFVEFKQPDPSQVARPVTSPTAAPAYTTSNAQSTLGTAGQPTVKAPSEATNFGAFFERLIEEANLKNPIFQGTDLKEYIDAKTELETIPDEATKIKTAFNVLKMTGLTKEKLMSTGQEYINLIDHELAGIEGAFSQQYKNDVQLKEEQIQAKVQELEALKTKIEGIRQEVASLSQQVASSKEQLVQNKNEFINAGQLKKAQLLSELQKINQYL